MIADREELPQEPFTWLGLHYNYYTINGQTLMRGSDHERYPDFRAESLRTFCRRYRLEELNHLYA